MSAPATSGRRRPRPGPVWLALLVLFVGGCASTTSNPPPPLVLGRENNDAVYDVVLGRVVEIRLPANFATDLRWAIDHLDTRVLALAEPPAFEQDPAKPAGTGTAVFRFRGTRIGNGMLRLAHRRPWEQAVKGEIFTAMIRVR